MTDSLNTYEMAALLAWLKEARVSRGLSMRDVAAKLGKPHSYVQKIESGERRLDVVEFVWYCRVLALQPEEGVKVVKEAEQVYFWPRGTL